jgi:hypothetical protein
LRTLIAILSVAVFALTAACSRRDATPAPYSATVAKVGESQAVLGWNMSLTNLRWDSDHVMVDIDAAPTDPGKPHAKPEDIRFGLYGTLAHPVEATGLGSCSGVTTLAIRPLASFSPNRLSGTVCIGPLQDQAAVRGVYVYSPRDRIPDTAAAYPAAFPVGLPPTKSSDTGLTITTSSVDAFRADGGQLTQQSLNDPTAFTGNGYMLLGVDVTAFAAQYRDDSAKRGGPLMLVVSPSLPPPGLAAERCAYGSSVLILPYAQLDPVHVNASLCTQGEINEAVLYATLSVVGTRAAVWMSRE